MLRRRIKQSTPPLKGRSAQLTEEARERARLLPPGKAREDLLWLAGLSEIASHVEESLNSPGLHPPRWVET
jgi:hypothetical protein